MQQPAASSPNPPASPPCEGGRKSGRKLARWNALLTEHYTRLHHRLLAFVRSRVSSDPTGEDLVQELYVRGPQVLPDSLLNDPDPERLFPYLCGCLKRFAAKRSERRARRARLRAERFQGVDREAHLEGQLGARFLCEEVLALLPEQDRELLWFRFAEGWYPREIAARIGKSPDWVSVRIHRAVARVRKRWVELEGGAHPGDPE